MNERRHRRDQPGHGALRPRDRRASSGHRLDELYTDDGVFDLSGLMGTELRYEGIDAINGFLTSMPMPLADIATNHYVFEADGEVQSRGKWFMPTDEGTVSGGVYRDVWAKTDQGWRLKERKSSTGRRRGVDPVIAARTGGAVDAFGPFRARTCGASGLRSRACERVFPAPAHGARSSARSDLWTRELRQEGSPCSRMCRRKTWGLSTG